MPPLDNQYFPNFLYPCMDKYQYHQLDHSASHKEVHVGWVISILLETRVIIDTYQKYH